MMRAFRLGLVQMRVEGGEKRRNLRRARELIRRAAGSGAEAALLPEAMDLGWTDPSACDHAEAIPDGSACDALRDAARGDRIYVCAGITERCGDVIYNAAVLFGPDGSLLLHHRKLNELAIGHDVYAQGDRLGVVSTPLARFGLMICADAFAPGQVVSRSLGLMGADVILSPSAWAVPASHDPVLEPYGGLWLDNYGPVARDFKLWIAGVSGVGWIAGGAWKGRKCIGNSLLVGPDGAEALRCPYGHDAEAVVVTDVHPVERPARGDGWADHWARSPV